MTSPDLPPAYRLFSKRRLRCLMWGGHNWMGNDRHRICIYCQKEERR